MTDDFGIAPSPIFGSDGTLTVEIKDDVSPEEAKLNRANLSKKDLDEAREYLLEFSKTESITARRALIVAAIVAYSRPFKISRGGETGGATRKLDLDLVRLLTPQDLALHHRIINLRDRAIAHSDYDFRPTRRVEDRSNSYSSGFLMWTKAFDVLEIEPGVGRLTALVEELVRHCVDEMFRWNQELSAREVKTT